MSVLYVHMYLLFVFVPALTIRPSHADVLILPAPWSKCFPKAIHYIWLTAKYLKYI